MKRFGFRSGRPHFRRQRSTWCGRRIATSTASVLPKCWRVARWRRPSHRCQQCRYRISQRILWRATQVFKAPCPPRSCGLRQPRQVGWLRHPRCICRTPVHRLTPKEWRVRSQELRPRSVRCRRLHRVQQAFQVRTVLVSINARNFRPMMYRILVQNTARRAGGCLRQKGASCSRCPYIRS